MAAIPVRMLTTKLRLRLGDMQNTKFSDYELLSALSSAWSMLWIALAENFSSLPRKTVEVILVNGASPLPEDFYSLVSLGEGVIEGTAKIEYNAVPPQITENDTEIAFPLSMTLDLVEVASAIASQNMSAATEIAKGTAARISQKREYSRIPDIRHFP